MTRKNEFNITLTEYSKNIWYRAMFIIPKTPMNDLYWGLFRNSREKREATEHATRPLRDLDRVIKSNVIDNIRQTLRPNVIDKIRIPLNEAIRAS